MIDLLNKILNIHKTILPLFKKELKTPRGNPPPSP